MDMFNAYMLARTTHTITHSAITPLVLAVGLIALSAWMQMHPANRDYEGAFSEPGLERWAVESAGMGGRRLGFRVESPTDPITGTFTSYGVDIRVRHYWAYHIFPRTWRWMQVSYPYVGNEWGEQPTSDDWTGVPAGTTAVAVFSAGGKRSDPVTFRNVYANEATTARAQDVQSVLRFLAVAEGPITISIDFYRGGARVLQREISAPPIGDDWSSGAHLVRDVERQEGGILTRVISAYR